MDDSVIDLSIAMRGERAVTVGDVIEGACTGGPDGDFLTDPSLTGVKTLAHDAASGKIPILINECCLPQDERYPGPLPWSELRELERALEDIDFYTRFEKGEQPDPGLCRRCRRLSLIREGAFTSNQKVHYRPFGTWFQLLFRTRCRICRLVVLSLSCGTFYLHPQLAAINPELQSTQLHPETLPSGERCLAIEFGLRRFGILRIITLANYRDVLRQAFEVTEDSPFELLADDRSVLHDKAGQTVSVKLIRQWIDDCEQNHGPNCNGHWRKLEPHKDQSINLIDVRERCLVQKNMDKSRYFALSYVWGESAIPQTTKANFESRKFRMSLSNSLPPTIEDAMRLVMSLNERYLWVDSLCIITDNAETKHNDILKMDAIYSHAVASIVALSGRNADSGLPGVRPGTRHPQRIECPQLHERLAGPDSGVVQYLDKLAGQNQEEHKQYLFSQNVAITLAGVTGLMRQMVDSDPERDLLPPEPKPIHVSSGMVAHPPSLKHILEMSVWNTRGWTLQERLLSRRCLYFSPEYVYFQCGEQTLCETGGNIHTWADVQANESAANAAEVLYAQETNPLLHFRRPSPTQAVSYENNDRRGVMLRQDIDVYSKLVEMYSKRALSFKSDMLNAVNGMLSVAHQRIGGYFIAGLPSKYFDLALLWSPAEPHDRLTSIGLGGNVFPTWSWTSWSGRKQYRLTESGRDSYGSLDLEYASSEIGQFATFHNGELVTVHKSSDSMRAVELRNLGHPSDTQYEYRFSKYIPYSDKVLSGISGPDFGPNVLQFWTFATSADSFAISRRESVITDPEHGNIAGKQDVTGVLDSRGKHCGLLFKPQAKTRYRASGGRHYEFILISSFGDARERRGGIKTMDSSVKPFDEYAFPWKGEGSGLVNLMLVEWFDDIAERLTMAQMHRQAWEAARPIYKHVRLA